jgi:hypothetical protein
MRGKGGGASSPRMADGGGNGGVRWRPEPLSHRRWTGGVEGGAVEERAWHSGVDEDDGVKKGKMGKRGGGGPDTGSGAVARPEWAAGRGESGTCAADRRGRAKSGPCGSG